MAKKFAHDTRNSLLDYAVIFLCLSILFVVFTFRVPVYFRDYSIVFEGSYRLLLGQVPFRDFGSPVGPVAFLLPALFFKLFAPTWTVLLWVQQLENAIMLIIMYGLLCKLEVRPLTRRGGLLIFTTGYLLLLTHPWYNSTALMLMLAATLAGMHVGLINALTAGALAGLTILTKQDFGLLALLISGFFVFRSGFTQNKRLILQERSLLGEKLLWGKAGIQFLIFLSSATVVAAICVVATDPQQFGYWFNYGQAPHERRTIELADLFGNSYGRLALFVGILSMLRNNLPLLVCAIFLLATATTRTTSGLDFTHYYCVAFVPVLLDEFLQMKIRWKPFLIFLALLGSMRVLARPFADANNIIQSIAHHQPEHFFFDPSLNTRPLVTPPSTLHAFSSHTALPPETISAIEEVKSVAREKAARHPIRVFNMTELTPIYAELGVAPPTGMPLWFHSKISLFPTQIWMIDRILASNEYDIVLLQSTHERLNRTYADFFSILKDNSAYLLHREVHDSPANATAQCAPECEGIIYVFVKKSP